MHVERHEVTATTSAGGAATVYTPVVTGRVLSVQYVKAVSGGFSDGVDFDVTAERTGEVILDKDDVNASAIFYPRAAVHDTTGTAATLDGTRAMRDAIHVAKDRIKIVVGSGGAVTTGTFYIIIG